MPLSTDYTKKLHIVVDASVGPLGDMHKLTDLFTIWNKMQDKSVLLSKAAADAAERDAARSLAAWQRTYAERERAMERYDAVMLKVQQQEAKLDQTNADLAIARANKVADAKIKAMEKTAAAQQAMLDRMQMQQANADKRAAEAALKLDNAHTALGASNAESALAQQRAQQASRQAALSTALGLGARVTAGAGLGLLAGGALLARSAVGWDTYVNQQLANSPLNAQEEKLFPQLALTLGARTGGDPHQILLALRYGAEYNLSQSRDIATLRAGMMLGLPTGGNEGIAPSASAIAMFMKNFPNEVSLQNPYNVANIILAASQHSRGVNAADFVNAIPEILTLAGHIGGTDQGQQALAMIAALTSAGLPLERARTQVDTMISKLWKPSQSTLKDITRIKNDTGVDLSGDFGYQAMSQKGLAGIIQDLHDKHIDPGTLNRLFPYLRGYFGALGLTSNQEQSFLNILQDVNHSTTGQGYPGGKTPLDANWHRYMTQSSTDVHKLQEEFFKLSVTLGHDLLPIYKDMLERDLIPGVKALDAFVVEHQDLMKAAVELAPKLVLVGAGLKAIDLYMDLRTGLPNKVTKLKEAMIALRDATSGMGGGLIDVSSGLDRVSKSATTTLGADAAATVEQTKLGKIAQGEKALATAARDSSELTTFASGIKAIDAAATTGMAGADGAALASAITKGGAEEAGILARFGPIGLYAAGLIALDAVIQNTLGNNGTSLPKGYTVNSSFNGIPTTMRDKSGNVVPAVLTNWMGKDVHQGGMTGSQMLSALGLTPFNNRTGSASLFGLGNAHIIPGPIAVGRSGIPTSFTNGQLGGWEAGSAHWDIGVTSQRFTAPGPGNRQYTVAWAGNLAGSKDPGVAELGRTIVLRSPNGGYELFGHLSKINVKTGQQVHGGQNLGVSGQDLFNGEWHLHVSSDANFLNYIHGYRPGSYGTGGGAVDWSKVPSGVAQWKSQILSASKRYGVPAALIAAVMQRESGGDPTAKSWPIPSNDGIHYSWGLMQIFDGNLKKYGLGDAQFIPTRGIWLPTTNDWTDPQKNIDAGTQILLHARGVSSNWDSAIRKYNAGEHATQATLSSREVSGYASGVEGAWKTYQGSSVNAQYGPPAPSGGGYHGGGSGETASGGSGGKDLNWGPSQDKGWWSRYGLSKPLDAAGWVSAFNTAVNANNRYLDLRYGTHDPQKLAKIVKAHPAFGPDIERVLNDSAWQQYQETLAELPELGISAAQMKAIKSQAWSGYQGRLEHPFGTLTPTHTNWASYWNGKYSAANRTMTDILQNPMFVDPVTGQANFAAMPHAVRQSFDQALRQGAFDQYMAERATFNADFPGKKGTKNYATRLGLMTAAWDEFMQAWKNPEAWYLQKHGGSSNGIPGPANRATPVYMVGHCAAEAAANVHRKATAKHGQTTAHAAKATAKNTKSIDDNQKQMHNTLKRVLHVLQKGHDKAKAPSGGKTPTRSPGR